MTTLVLATLCMSATIPIDTTLTARQAFAYEFRTNDGVHVGILAKTSPQIRIPITGWIDIEAGRWQIDPFSITVPAISTSRAFDVEVKIPYRYPQEICDINGCIIIPERPASTETRPFTASASMDEMTADFPVSTGRIVKYNLDHAVLAIDTTGSEFASVDLRIEGTEESATRTFSMSGLSGSYIFKRIGIERDETGQVVNAWMDPLSHEAIVTLDGHIGCADGWCAMTRVVPEPSGALLAIASLLLTAFSMRR